MCFLVVVRRVVSVRRVLDHLAALYYYLGMVHLICQEIIRSGGSVPGLSLFPARPNATNYTTHGRILQEFIRQVRQS